MIEPGIVRVKDQRSRHEQNEVARAIANILEDTSNERDQLELTQKAMLNILYDFEDASAELRTANEELTHLDELKSEFVAMASHELRTPLTSIAGFASTMLDNWSSISDAAKFEFVGIIDEQSQRLSRLVSSLLTISRIESGVLEPNPQSFLVGPALRQAVQNLDVGDGEDVEVICSEQLLVFADGDHFQQIVVNYLANAFRHGSAPVRVEAERIDGAVTIRVIDHGTGVPAEFVPQLFERFAQANGDQSRSASGGRGNGAGLGLSIVQALIRAQGGEASYEHNLPTGSCFIVRFPAAPPRSLRPW